MGSYKILRKIYKILLCSTLITGSALGYHHILTHQFFQIGTCQGESMKPTLQSKYLLLFRKFNVYNVKKGDIVVYRSPYEPEKCICKRVIHLSDEVVESPIFSGKIPKGYIWVEGDNSAESIDSRQYGPVPKGLIIGIVVFAVWPLGLNLNI